ncbi:hypothetical protein LEMLEM_LOCUS11320 [Lemmus lemmus]
MCLFVLVVSEASVHGKRAPLLQACDEGRISRQWECVEEKANHFTAVRIHKKHTERTEG